VAGRLLSQRTLGRAPQTGARALVDDPAQGGLLAAFAGTVGAFWTCSRTGNVGGKKYIPARVNRDIKIVELHRL